MGKLFSREGLTPFLIISNVLIWISSIIVMGILSYWIDQQPRQPTHLVYEEVIVSLLPVKILFGGFLMVFWCFFLFFSFFWL
jgi:hypothetical protein